MNLKPLPRVVKSKLLDSSYNNVQFIIHPISKIFERNFLAIIYDVDQYLLTLKNSVFTNTRQISWKNLQ